MIENMPEGSTVNLAIKSAGYGIRASDPAGDDVVIARLDHALSIAVRRNIRILIYTHIQFWVEKHSDAIRLCEKIAHPNLGLTFSSLQWYAGDAQDLVILLRRASPHLKQVNLSGIRRSPLGFFGIATIQPLDSGELDNCAVAALFNRLGYQGWIGYSGWQEGGDAFNKLERSLRALKDIERRIHEHPHWGSYIDG